MILGNVTLLNKLPVKFSGGATEAGERSNFQTSGRQRSLFVGQGGIDAKNGVPNGYRPPYCWTIPKAPGGLASYTSIWGLATLANGNLAGGRNAAATLAGVGAITNAAGQLIVSAVATLSGVGALTADIAGKLEAAAVLAGTGAITAALGALASAVATIIGTGAVAADLRAIGHMSAEVTPFTELSPENLAAAVWNAVAAEFSSSGTMGEKLNNLPDGVQKNAALNNFTFVMLDASDHVTPKTGLTVTSQRAIDGGGFSATANSPSEVGNGVYKINLAASDLAGDVITLRFTASGADPRIITVLTQQ